ncbi:MAG: GDSL-type esterase/lipase family protein [Ignavibacteriaceae bacterium]
MKRLYFFTLIIFHMLNINLFLNAQQRDTSKIIIMFGDSITHNGKWEEVLNRTDVVNWGIPGYTTQQLSWTIKDILHQYRPKICFIEGGINDLTLGITIDRIYQNQVMVMDSLAHNNVNPVYQTTLYQLHNEKVNRTIDALNFLMQKYCEHHNYGFIDLRTALSKDGDMIPELTTDGTHLKPEAYIMWGNALQEYLKQHHY